MAKRKNENARPGNGRKHAKSQKAKEDKKLKALYARMRKKFTAADLQKYTVIEKGVPAEQVLAEMERIHQRLSRKRA